jgi:hypothetical protein
MENNMYYSIDSTTFAVSIFDGVNEEPFQYQPHYPNGDSFDNVAEATAWAEEAVQSHDPGYGFFPPIGKGMESEPKPTAEQMAAIKLSSIGLTVEELKTLLGL